MNAKKPDSLRKALEAALPELRKEPDRLRIWIEDGAVRHRQTEDLGFSFEYPLSVLLTEMKTDIAIIVLPIIRWLRVHQPDLVAADKARSFAFETDILDAETADILFTIDLVERVKVAQNEDGSWQLDYLEEPDPLFEDGEGFEGTDPIPDLSDVDVDTIVIND